MAVHQAAKFFGDCNQVPGGELVVLSSPHLSGQTFALSCVQQNNRMLAVLSDNYVGPNVKAPCLDSFAGPCVSFGSDFIIGFDATSIVVDATPQLGELLIGDDGKLYLAAHQRPQQRGFGGPCLVDLSTGAIATSRQSAVIRNWSISIDAQQNGRLVPVFESEHLRST